MKPFLALFAFFTASSFLVAQTQPSDPKLAARIDSVIGIAKQYRAITKELYMTGQSGTKEFSEAQAKLTSIDSSNYYEVKSIIDKEGFPGFDKVGKASSHNFWILAQFYERDMVLQGKTTELMKIEMEKGNASKEDFAFLVDKYLANKSEPQIYGTQIKLNDEHTSFEAKPMVDPDKVNERRQKMGLKPLADYIKETNERYYKSVGKSY